MQVTRHTAHADAHAECNIKITSGFSQQNDIVNQA